MDAGQLEALYELARTLEAWGKRINLSGHRDLEAILLRLIADAMALHCEIPDLGSLADLGSGAGFPGLPFAILRPHTSITLVDARERRQHFQKAAARRIGATNVAFVLGRAEQVVATPHQGVVAQAMSRPNQALAWMVGWAAPGALLIVPGGESAPRIDPRPDVDESSIHRYQVPCGGPARTLWVGRYRGPAVRSR